MGTQICYLHHSHRAPARLCESFSVRIVNTICHTACPDAASPLQLPGRKAFFIMYADRTLSAVLPGEGKKSLEVSRTPGTCPSDSWSGGLGHHFLGWEVSSQISWELDLILPPARCVTLGKVPQSSGPLCSHP